MSRQRLLNLSFILVAALLTLTAAWTKGREGVEGLLWGARTVFGGPWRINESGRVNLGVYDPDDALGNSKRVALDHLFVSWLDFDADALRARFAQARKRERWMMVTVEPFARPGAANRETLLADVVAGRYDNETDLVCRTLGALDFPILLRWGHEMETPTGRYPWAHTDAAMYIAAYRHFIDRCRAQVKETYLVWSPRGDTGMERYFPGRDYVDYVGVSLYALPAFDIDTAGRPQSFVENFREKYERARRFNLPVMIAELGVEGTQRYRRDWLEELQRSLGKFPTLKTIVLFNALEPEGVYAAKYGRPDWRVDPALLD